MHDGFAPRSNWIEVPMICRDRDDQFTISANNYLHNHVITGRLDGQNIVGASTMTTTPETPRAAYSDANTESYDFVPDSVGVSYFLRID